MIDEVSPLVSIVIPVYNRAHIISRALDSVVSQSYKNYEVIIIDDCSADTDLLLSNLKKYQDSFDLVYVRHEENLHGAAARNTGVRLAKGSYVAFLDSDDAWKFNKLECCIEALISTGADFAFSGLEKVGLQVGFFPKSKLRGDESYSDYLLANGGVMQTSTLVVKKSIFSEVEFDDDLIRFQDYDLILSLQKIGASACYIDKVLVTMFDDDQVNRISNSVDPKPAIAWLQKIENDISDKAYAGFVINRIVKYLTYSGCSKEARSYLKDERVCYSIPLTERTKLLFLTFLPVSFFPLLRTVVAQLKKGFFLIGKKVRS